MVDGGQEGRLPQLLLPRLQEGEAARPARPGAHGLPQLLRQQCMLSESASPFQSGRPAPDTPTLWKSDEAPPEHDGKAGACSDG